MILPGAVVVWALLLLIQEGPAPTAFLPQAAENSPDGSAQATDTEQDKLPAHLYVSVNADEAYVELIQRLSDEWMNKHPNWRVTINGPENDRQDIKLVPNDEVISLASAGKLLPVDGFVSPSGGEMSPGDSGHDPFAYELRWRSYWWGVPAGEDPLVLLWSKQLLQQSGLKHPPANWQELTHFKNLHPNLAAASVSSKDGRGALAWLDYWHGEGAAMKPELSQAALSSSAQGGAAMLAPAATPEDAVKQLQQGRSLSAVVPWSYFRKQQGLAEQVETQLAIGSGGGAYARNGFSFVLFSDTEYTAAAASWVTAMTSQQAQEQLFLEGGRLPSNPALYTAATLTKDSRYPPAAWRKLMFQNESDAEGKRLNPEQLAVFQSLWLAYWAPGGSGSADQLAEDWGRFLKA
ncbi:extracellular solute-binding protein [Paenibacillus pasadenensis]|uniref:extracellular solute-binding protein n=1 Tax=Paenibacillus pasadenensis TaxID=217090 RepID=UPI00203F1E05|nr:extracellular solute-binding protein [Paenibacillus pasadenensis]MCM3746333.1 extracellular solute-binding protein [Paenibacillus pasadenensis]